MPIATHLIKIEGIFNEDWNEEKLKRLVKRKFVEIDKSWHADLELFGIKKNIIKVWVYVQEAAYGLANKETIGKWLHDHINEKGIVIKNFEISKVPYEEGFVIGLNSVGIDNL